MFIIKVGGVTALRVGKSQIVDLSPVSFLASTSARIHYHILNRNVVTCQGYLSGEVLPPSFDMSLDTIRYVVCIKVHTADPCSLGTRRIYPARVDKEVPRHSLLAQNSPR